VLGFVKYWVLERAELGSALPGIYILCKPYVWFFVYVIEKMEITSKIKQDMMTTKRNALKKDKKSS